MAGLKDGKMDGKQFGHAMNTIAHAETMMAAVRDYKKEMKANEKAKRAEHTTVDVEQLFDDPELQKLHEERLARLKADQEKRQILSQKGHGQYSEITEGEFLEIVTQADSCVAHFFHRDFERCKIMDKHLAVLARQYFDTRFIKISAPDASFFTVKLNVKMLPCLIIFRNGVSVDRIVGFEIFGKDHFDTDDLEEALFKCGAITEAARRPSDEDQLLEQRNRVLRPGLAQQAARQAALQRGSDDESSDFDD